MARTPGDLQAVDVALLGVLCLGLPPSLAAGDDTFRVDHVTAVVAALHAGREGELHLAADGVRVGEAFRMELREAIVRLTGLGILGEQPEGMPAAPGGFEAGLAIDVVDPDTHPTVLDRWLAQQCMERLFNSPAVYPYLVGQYARSGEFWRAAREGGYQR